MSWNRMLPGIGVTLMAVIPLMLSACKAETGDLTVSTMEVPDPADAPTAEATLTAVVPEDCADAEEDCCEGEVVPDCCPDCGKPKGECDCGEEHEHAEGEDCPCKDKAAAGAAGTANPATDAPVGG